MKRLDLDLYFFLDIYIYRLTICRVISECVFVYLLMRHPDVSRHHAAHSSHVSGGYDSCVLQVSQSGGTLFRERLATMPMQGVVARICFTQLIHLSQEITLLFFQYRDLHLREKRDCARVHRVR